jgi:hypothetical protein
MIAFSQVNGNRSSGERSESHVKHHTACKNAVATRSVALGLPPAQRVTAAFSQTMAVA